MVQVETFLEAIEVVRGGRVAGGRMTSGRGAVSQVWSSNTGRGGRQG